MSLPPRLLIFIKNPIPGKVKTRLAATLGDERALEIYRHLLEHTRQVSLAFPGERHLFYSHFLDDTDDWNPGEYMKALQTPGDLGLRMETAFRQVFEPGDAPTLIIGSDCPLLSSDILQQAVKALETHPLVLGPATDGGYYLLGMRQFIPQLFQNIRWSTEHVAAETLACAASLDLAVAQLPALPDIDYESDWEKYGQEV